MMRILTILAAILLSATSLAAKEVSLSEINRYLNAMRSAKASFVQANPDKTLAQGVLYLRKPGRIRYEYTAPADSLVISDGQYLGIFDKKSNRGAQRYDLRKTPLDLLLSDRIDLSKPGVVRDLRSDGVKTRIVAGDPQNPKAGSIAMVFTGNPTELRQWIVTDRAGRQTTVILNDLQITNRISNDLFDIAKTEAALRR